VSDKAELAVVSFHRDYVIDELSREFTLHTVGSPEKLVEELGPAAARVRGVVTSPMVGVSAELMDALPKLEIAALFGVGLERADLEHARKRGIVVTTTPVLYEDVADLAMVLAIDVSRQVSESDRWVRAGNWSGRVFPPARRFSGKRAGILGMGRIGRMLARRLAAFDMEIAYYDPKPAPDVSYRAYPSGVELARESDFLFLCAAGGPSGGHIVGAEMLDALGPKGVFVNVARGWLVDEPALVDAVVNGKIGGAGLDVFDDEPNVPEALLAADNVVLLPHVGSSSVETRQAMDECVVENIRSWFSSGKAVTPVP
jgi:lactate dehydrogenase-like 2-hydroxyacid dehydrogenase